MEKETKKYIKNVRKYLVDRYGKVNDEWEGVISLLADNMDLYIKCKEEIEKTGIFDAAGYKKNPLLSTMKDLQATILKQIQHLGLSPYSSAKINDKTEDDTDDFLENLIK